MEHSAADESDVALADLPSTSGAHWANRDSERRRPGSSTPFRRPPAVHSFPDGSGNSQENRLAWFGTGMSENAGEGADSAGWDAGGSHRRSRDETSAPPSGPARASFGVTDGPISGARPEAVSPAETGAWPGAGATSDTGDWPAPDNTGDWGMPGNTGDWPASDNTGDWPAGNTGDWRGNSGDWPAAGDSGDWGSTGDWLTVGDRQAEPPAGEAEPPAGETTGGVGEFISGPGREIRPHRAGRGPAAETAPPPGAPRRSRLAVAATVALSATVLLGGAVAGVAFFSGEDSGLTSVLQLGSGDTGGKVASAPLDNRKTASFELVAATTKVTVRSQDLGDDLYRIASAGDSGTAPRPVLEDNRVQLLLSPDGDGASGVVEVVLSNRVTWGLRFVGGADEQIVNFTGGRISGLDLAGGSRRVDLTLPAPTGTVPVRVTGAIEDFSITSPAGNPVRVRVDSGAKTVAAGDRTLRDVEPGSTLTPKGWKVPNRYDVDAASRVTLLSVRTAE